ncbi:MAG: alpha/beta hydrolase, partial [Bifidobacteriaceae bacterium]|nr:alpha/beta hydrolase [Bifidobacteriaceae bacterium]
VGEALRRLGVARAVVAGISMGGYVALEVLRARAERLAGLILMHTKATADTPEGRAARLAVARQVLADNSVDSLRPMATRMVSAESRAARPELVGRVERWIAEASPAGVAWAQEAMASRRDALGLLRAAGLPAMVVAGEDDPFSSLTEAEAMAEALGVGVDLEVLAGVGHLGPIESPSSLARAVRGFYWRAVG